MRARKRKEELGWRKPQLESSHLNKPTYKSIHGDVKKKKKKKTSKSYNAGKESKKIWILFFNFNDVSEPI